MSAECAAEKLTAAPQINWPSPPEWPLYVPVERAAKIAGVSYETMREWVDAIKDPMPHILIGRSKKLVRVAAIPEYMRTKEL